MTCNAAPLCGERQTGSIRIRRRAASEIRSMSESLEVTLVEVLAQPLERVHGVGDYHRISSQVVFRRTSEIDAVVVACGGSPGRPSARFRAAQRLWPYTTRGDVNDP